MSRSSSFLLLPFGVLYDGIVCARAALYRRGILKVSTLPAPVISIGNITTGGTGKTPLVEWVARRLAAEGRNVCILTRGYGRQQPSKRVVLSDGQNILASASVAGDEPRLLAENLDGIAAVICDADRFAAGLWALKEFGSDAFVLDDGFQHQQLARNLNIVTIDATNPWGGGHVLPHGRLRESRSALSRADCVVISRVDQPTDITSLRNEINSAGFNGPIFTSRMIKRAVRSLSAPANVTPSLLTKPLAAFCAVGNPGSFEKQLHDEHYQIALFRSFADHHNYTESDIHDLAKSAKQAGAVGLITTAKDAVKLHGFHFDLPCYVLDIEIVIDDETRLLDLIRSKLI